MCEKYHPLSILFSPALKLVHKAYVGVKHDICDRKQMLEKLVPVDEHYWSCYSVLRPPYLDSLHILRTGYCLSKIFYPLKEVRDVKISFNTQLTFNQNLFECR